MELTSTRTRAAGRLAPLAALTLVCLLLVGCSAAGSSQRDTASDSVAEPDLGRGFVDGGGAESGDAAIDQQVISAASITITSTDPVAAADSAVDIVIDVDGHVDARTDTPTGEGNQPSSQLVLRIPSGDLDATMIELKSVGDLVRSSLSQTDVTTEAVNLDARIAALETSVDRLLTLMSTATTTADLITIESALSQRQVELDGLVAQRDALGDLVDYATVDLFISTPGEVAGAAPGDFWGGIVVGFQSLIGFIGGLLVVIGVIVPWLIPVGLLALLLWWLVRRRDRASSVRLAQGGAAATPEQMIPPRPPLPPHETQPRVDDTVR